MRSGRSPEVQWTGPALLWPGDSNTFDQPWLVELQGDRFLPDFLDMLGGRLPASPPTQLGNMQPTTTVRGGSTAKLFQPLHNRYYLVTGSLVCRQLGLPDKTVVRRDNEATSFVLRRRKSSNQAEEGWVEEAADRGWHALGNECLLADEERFPVHAVQSNCRSIHYGYISVDSREKYLTPLDNPVGRLQTYHPPATPGVSLLPEPDVRLTTLETRVLRPWRALSAEVPPPSSQQVHEASLFLLLDLADVLSTILPDVYAAAVSEATPPPMLPTANKTLLLTKLRDIGINGDTVRLPVVLRQVQPFAGLLLGESIANTPQNLDVQNARHGSPRTALGSLLNPGLQPDTLYKLVSDAIGEGATPITVPPELDGMLKSDPPSTETTYVIRFVYERPGCPPTVSKPTPPFVFAKALDPDAPARKLRVELPSVKDLHKFKRGIAMETPADLRNVVDKVNKGMLSGSGLSGGDNFELGVVCSFSIQIITMVAFIVMFIFLIALNFIFWWLPLLKICFPLPAPRSSD